MYKAMKIIKKGNGIYVGIDGNNNLLYSYDGENWTDAKLPKIAFWSCLCYGNGKFVAVAFGYDIAIYSEDGIEWKESEISEAFWTSVCYGGDKFVAVAGFSNKAAYSEDGINWTKTELPEKANWRFVCYGNDKFIAVAPYSDIAAYSTDGINWTKY